MKKILLLTIITFISYIQLSAQKFDKILEKSNLNFNYGISHDFFAKSIDSGGPGNTLDLTERDVWGQIFGFEYSYRLKGKNEIGFGFSKQVHRRVYNQSINTSFTTINFDDNLLRNSKNFHSIHWKRHLIEDKLLTTVGFYNLRYRDEDIGIIAISDETIVNIRNSVRVIDFGVWVGLEYYYDIRNFQVGLRSRLFYTQGYSFDSFESFEFTPVIKFKL
ncbi:hypothetical protein [Belliella aquatica]|uniref:Outer membrane protein beta-barrel domain-containing protein n=1 Tax=Belliella aquatica TaxID=1323734 RepID=A0ABQ1MPM9_9BACT|nr:hypothetical protein [Belliella aquatica]MCH7405340.1 hypothetical protein [Belliella aquatica]GGC42407.1 hypothetical protein GCM10010993_21260 [Belliella aquatica]